MRKIIKRPAGLFLFPAMALALSAFAANAQTQGATSSANGTPPRETQRGVPGTDVDIGTNRGTSKGVPGVDVDIGKEGDQRNVRTDVNTRASGASGSTSVSGQGRTRADRN